MNKRDYDIVIAGGGMIGTSLALALAPLGLRVAVVEAVARREAAQPSFDDRSTALSRSTQRMFEAMGLWPDIVAASTPIRAIHVSDQGRFGFSHIDADEQRVEALGYVVINRVLGGVLQAALDEQSIDVLCPARIVDVELAKDAARASVEFASGERQTLACALLVAADGANSTVRDMLGITAQQSSYGQRAVIGNLLTEKAIDNVAYERFTPQGPLAVLPVADGRAGFVWTVSADDADRVMALDDHAFLGELQAQFGHRLGRFSRIGKRVSYPLILSKALRLTATRSVLIGNSAHGLHPVSAQGFNLGMRDVAAIVDCIADARTQSGDFDPGATAILSRYADWRRADQKKLVRFTDSLVKLFGSERRPLRVLRNIGMLGFDLVPGVRRVFARHTMGLAGRLPRLSRGVPVR
ncbi:MAG: 2-octaprenyl-6-methoxyphenyl hydroxylase [Gammaproteobacteria bacterium]|nr:2-octaprenyl-6-methoxyphenyl hydroxylase [Gammaproteobacteria bacterium]NNF49666.1 2-octaprenyl-6-methoxyphenyl hydroxylase [Woeseiaceae bacterium]MBT8093708.1 2-octaprenyl-6-methoxyphenyl hydroxylase [Gammaproteobacteria bacterium]MBT8105614.1 2-octaprenyl-6-methoxyphenyl hydroxylase [Gammaproteobacteria bacterium]NNK25628.1 2-octaprenyl-6-methoxyphenyl hydroxylase [Woeseiaceae bacterium]